MFAAGGLVFILHTFFERLGLYELDLWKRKEGNFGNYLKLATSSWITNQ